MRNSIKLVLEFYKELGFERLPLEFSNELTSSGDKIIPAPCDNPPIPPLEKGGTTRFRGGKGGFETRGEQGISKESALNALRAEIGDCRKCGLAKGRTHIVFGEGSSNAKIMFIGEAPGREEDIQGRPFVGDAGQLLTRLIEKMKLKREEVYIANIVKCRPPMNRDPREDEMSACFPFLDKQIEIISPQVIVSLGKISTYTLLNIKGPIAKFSITRTRGKFGEYRGIPVMPTFHPAYLIRNPKDKWLTWEDAQAVLKKLED